MHVGISQQKRVFSLDHVHKLHSHNLKPPGKTDHCIWSWAVKEKKYQYYFFLVNLIQSKINPNKIGWLWLAVNIPWTNITYTHTFSNSEILSTCLFEKKISSPFSSTLSHSFTHSLLLRRIRKAHETHYAFMFLFTLFILFASPPIILLALRFFLLSTSHINWMTMQNKTLQYKKK